jgi:hypothetical protein
MELELLFDSLLSLERAGTILVNPDIQDQLHSESTKKRNYSSSRIMSQEMKLATKELSSNTNIVIRKADKSNTYVILNKEDYKHKLDTILQDTTKFRKITRNPTNELKIKVNKLIKTVNRDRESKILTPIVGDYSGLHLW